MALLILLVLILCTIILICIYLKNWLRLCMLALRLPGPKAYPLIGSILHAKDSDHFHDLGRTAHETYGSIIKAWLTVIPVIFTLDPKVIQIILGSNKHTEKSFLYSFLHTFVGEGLITNNGMKWKHNRKLIQPYFRKNILDTYISVFYNNSKNVINQLKDKTTVNITSYVNNNILQILQECVLGISKNDVMEYKELQNSPFRKGNVLLMYRVLRPWYLLNSLYKNTAFAKEELHQKSNLHEYIRLILKLRRSGKLTASKRKSLMEMFIEISKNNPQQFHEEDIINEICTFMLAGQDSVGGAVAFALYYLAKHEEIQEIARKEIDTVLTDKEFSTLDLDRLKYLEQCIKETLRLCPSVPIISRKLTEDTKIGENNFPKDTMFFIAPFGTHRLKHIYNDPETFNPDRFSPENEEKLPPFSYIPFSAGPRNCIGYKFAMMEMKTFIAIVLKNFKLSVPTNYKLRLVYRITTRAKGGIWLNLARRNE